MTLYDTLGVDKDATHEDIKKAYYDKAKENHPDLESGDDDAMKEINHAYAVLKTEESRKRYDESGDEDGTVDNTKAKVMNLVVGLVGELINKNPENIPFALSQIRSQWQSAYQRGRRKIFNEIKRFETFKFRIVKPPKEGMDIITAVIEENIRTLKRQLKDFDDDYDCRLKAFELLDKYSFSDILNNDFVHIGNWTMSTAG